MCAVIHACCLHTYSMLLYCMHVFVWGIHKCVALGPFIYVPPSVHVAKDPDEIGRASCRERVFNWV